MPLSHDKSEEVAKLKKLRSSLPKGWALELAGKTGLSIGTVRNVLYGTQNNFDVLNAAVALAKAHKAGVESLTAQIDAL
ncbi:hypothetical protein [Mucilaginibacter sp. CSA2-8R]|uniref:hypothetical protein n=1 Tax=Mucilaginibacter sp. CSA2-8R TaxID=3141542 RepID=UPI00315CB673